MPVTLRAMQLFVAAVDTGNFSEVARREGVAPSSVSRVIQQMEAELSTQLLYRNTRAVVPTEAGRVYVATFRRMLAEMEEATQQVRGHDQDVSGLVRINAPVVFGEKHVAPWLGALLRAYPALRVELAQTDDFIDPLTGAADLLFRIAPLQDSASHVRVIDKPVYHMAASPAYLERRGTPLTPSDLYQHDCLVYKGSMGSQRSFFTGPQGDAEVHAFEGPLMSNHAGTLLSAALEGAGVVMMPDWLIGDALQEGRLLPVLRQYDIATQQDTQVIAMLYPRTRFVPQSTRVVIDYFVRTFGTPPYWKTTTPM